MVIIQIRYFQKLMIVLLTVPSHRAVALLLVFQIPIVAVEIIHVFIVLFAIVFYVIKSI